MTITTGTTLAVEINNCRLGVAPDAMAPQAAPVVIRLTWMVAQAVSVVAVVLEESAEARLLRLPELMATSL